VGGEVLCAVIFTHSQVVAELSHAPLRFLTSVTGLVQVYCA